MDRFREKVIGLRAEVAAAMERADSIEANYKALQQSHTDQEREIISLKNQNKQLQADLERALLRIESLKAIEQHEDRLIKHNDASQRKIVLLEDELEKTEKALREVTKNFREADIKAEHFERKVQQLENTNIHLEMKNEDLKMKLTELQTQLDDFNASLIDI